MPGAQQQQQQHKRAAWYLMAGLLAAVTSVALGAVATYWTATGGQGASIPAWRFALKTPAKKQQEVECPTAGRMPGERIPAEANMTYEACLRRHGRPLEAEFQSQWLEVAKKSTGKARLDAMTRHVVAGWLDALARGRGTPCRPLIVRWRCTNEARCGGIGDRINGVQTAFWMALTTHSVFVMDWTRPVPLTEYFLPFDDALGFDGHRACLSAPELRWAKHNPMVESSQRRNDTAIQETIAAAEAFSAAEAWSRYDAVELWVNKGYLPHVMRSPDAGPALARYGLHHSPIRDLLYICSRLYLSRPALRLQALAAPWLARLGDTARVGVHVRYGDATLQVYGPSQDRRYHAGAAACWVRQATQQCYAMSPRPCTVFITADSDEAIATIQSRLKAVNIDSFTVPGTVAHIDRQVEVNETNYETIASSLEKDYLDWYLLTQMEVLLLSTSKFSSSAAYSALPAAAVLLPRGAVNCTFRDFLASCVGLACPGQLSAAKFQDQAWTLGTMDRDDSASEPPALSKGDSRQPASDERSSDRSQAASRGERGKDSDKDKPRSDDGSKRGGGGERNASDRESDKGSKAREKDGRALLSGI